MSFCEFYSESISGNYVDYTVDKYRCRRQWALCAHHPTFTEAVAYFRSEHKARQFAAAFNLTITEAS